MSEYLLQYAICQFPIAYCQLKSVPLRMILLQKYAFFTHKTNKNS